VRATGPGFAGRRPPGVGPGPSRAGWRVRTCGGWPAPSPPARRSRTRSARSRPGRTAPSGQVPDGRYDRSRTFVSPFQMDVQSPPGVRSRAGSFRVWRSAGYQPAAQGALLFLGVLVVLLGSAEGLVVNPLAVDHGVLERVRSAVVHDSADDGVLFVATHSSVSPFFAGRSWCGPWWSPQGPASSRLVGTGTPGGSTRYDLAVLAVTDLGRRRQRPVDGLQQRRGHVRPPL